jgi:hypothetical protein
MTKHYVCQKIIMGNKKNAEVYAYFKSVDTGFKNAPQKSYKEKITKMCNNKNT